MPEFPDDLRLYVGLASAGTLLILGLLALYLAIRSVRFMLSGVREARSGTRFNDRQARSLEDFYQAFYAAERFPRETVLDTVTRFATAAHVPAQFLKPDDSFAMFEESEAEDCEQFAMDTALLIKEAELHFGTNLFGGRLVTLDDYVRVHVLAARLAKRDAVGNKS
jgi:hypothetical protein